MGHNLKILSGMVNAAILWRAVCKINYLIISVENSYRPVARGYLAPLPQGGGGTKKIEKNVQDLCPSL